MRASRFPRALRFRVANGLARIAGWLSGDARPEPAPAPPRAAVPSVVMDVVPPRHWREMAEPAPPPHWMERVREAAPHLLANPGFPVLPRFEAAAEREEASFLTSGPAPALRFPPVPVAAEQPPASRKEQPTRPPKQSGVHWMRRPVVSRGARQSNFPSKAAAAEPEPVHFVDLPSGRAAHAQPRWETVRVPPQGQPEYSRPFSADEPAQPSPEWPRPGKAETIPVELPEPGPATPRPPSEYPQARAAHAAPVSWPSAFATSVGEPELPPEEVESNRWPELPAPRSGFKRDDALAMRRREHLERLTREQQGL